MVDWRQVRSRFPSLEGKVFLNTATIGQLPEAAHEALLGHLQRRNDTAGADMPQWFTDLEQVKRKAAKVIHAEASDIALIPSTAFAISTLLNGIDWKPGDRVITFEHEFPNNLYAPSLLERKGVEFLEIPYDSLDEHLNERTRLVLISALNYITGFRAPVAELRAKLDRFGTLLYLDATQGCGGIEFNMREMKPDMMAVHGYKWLLSPTGAGFMYVKPSVRQWLEPTVIGWRSHGEWKDFGNLHHGIPVFSETADRYEGYMPAIPLFYAMEPSLDLFSELTPAAIETRILELAEYARAKVEALGGTVANKNTPILACRFPRADASDLARKLAAENIQVSARRGLLRVSVHLYNDEGDLDLFSSALAVMLEH